MLKLNKFTAIRSALLVASLFMASFAFSNEFHADPKEKIQVYSTCISEAQAIHPKVISCIELEVVKKKKNIETYIKVASKDPSLRELVSSITETDQLWAMYIERLCGTYQHLGGQRGELLMENCILNEVSHRELLLKNILEEAAL